MHNAGLHPFIGMDVWTLLSARARSHAGHPFLVWQPFDSPSRTWTFDEFAAEASAVAAGLASRGVGRGDRVLIHLDNSPEFLISWFACAALGAVAVSTNTRSTVDELSYFIGDSEPTVAITQPELLDVVGASASGVRHLVVTSHDARAGAAAEPFSRLRAASGYEPGHDPDPLAPCAVQYTSGTTSRAKGVIWTHANALWGARTNAAHETLRGEDCHLVYKPLFHTDALAYSVLPSLWVGARFVLVPKWSTSRFWDISLRHGCTWLSLMGLVTRSLYKSEPPAGHRYRLFGGPVGDLPIDGRYGVKTIGWFGMTETVSHPVVGDAFLPNRPLSMGRPAPEYEVKVVEQDGLTPVKVGAAGEMLVRGVPGVSLFAGYLNQPHATADAFDEQGFFRTGDRAIRCADGHLVFDNRTKDMLKVGAENVSAAEVEQTIKSVPGVVEASVVGRPDRKLDEVPVAFVISKRRGPDLVDRIDAACRQRLADFKRPRAVYLVDALPRTTMSKVNKVELRQVAGETEAAQRAAAERRWVAELTEDS
ncbi:MAG TPA: AMP-binding protein [Pseudonocardia sp.]|jgi:crotonobetaine/carnitine-CoA ligase|nr:AMP-binding protein [Pseudonocardia sp.]